jgi:hypothetical protein
MKHLLADVQNARALTVAMLRAAAEDGKTMGEALVLAQRFLEYRGYPAPEDPLAFATNGRTTMYDGDLSARFVVSPSGEVI